VYASAFSSAAGTSRGSVTSAEMLSNAKLQPLPLTFQ
jgi:hypothetical protein